MSIPAPFSADKDHESIYLKNAVGHVLPKALASCIAALPEDPVEFVALYLKKHLEMEQLKAEVTAVMINIIRKLKIHKNWKNNESNIWNNKNIYESNKKRK